jgi:hypothetical protein
MEKELKRRQGFKGKKKKLKRRKIKSREQS